MSAAIDIGPEAVFHARGLTKLYRLGDVEVQALRGVDLDLFEGELVVLLGPSGSGKLTLLNVTLGASQNPRGSCSSNLEILRSHPVHHPPSE